MDLRALAAILSFCTQIAAGVAPVKWPQYAWLADLIFWGACFLGVSCLVWWIISHAKVKAWIRARVSKLDRSTILLIAIAGMWVFSTMALAVLLWGRYVAPTTAREAAQTDSRPFQWVMHFQGGTDAHNVRYINRIVFEGSHKENGPIRLMDAVVVSRIHGESTPLLIPKEHRLIAVKDSSAVPPNVPFVLVANIFEGQSANALPGLSIADFLNRWGSFSLVLEFMFNLQQASYMQNYEYNWVKQKLIDEDPSYPAAPFKLKQT